MQFAGKTRQFVSQKHKASKLLLFYVVQQSVVHVVIGVGVVVAVVAPAVKCTVSC